MILSNDPGNHTFNTVVQGKEMSNIHNKHHYTENVYEAALKLGLNGTLDVIFKQPIRKPMILQNSNTNA